MKPPPSFARLVTILAIALLPVACALTQETALNTWPPASDLATDPEIVSGRLENGIRYAVRVNREPRERASLRLLVQAGSLDETDDERGLAHYLEHMGFNGTENFPADTLVEYFQRLGMSFGADTNAYTSFNRTVYMLELPHGDTKSLAEGFAVLRDFAGGMLIDEKEVEKERGVIFSEKRTRDSVEFRTALAEYDFLFDGTILADRFPIGISETLEAANSGRLRGFYRRWYRPENIALVAVGDLDPAEAVRLIGEAFTSMKGIGESAPRADRGKPVPSDAPVAVVHREVEASSVTVSIQVVSPGEKRPDTVANRVRDLPLDVANAMIRRRLDRLAKQEDAPYTYGTAATSDAYDLARVSSIELTGPPGSWRESFAIAEQELRRALEFGFSEPELREITANVINAYEEAVRAAPTRRSNGLADGLVGAIDEDDVFTTPETNLEIVRAAVERLTLDDCLAALREAWRLSAPRLFVSGRLPDGVDETAVIATFGASRAIAVTAPESIADEAWAYTEFGPPGEVVSRRHVDDLDVVLVRFANDVRLNLKRTDFEKNTILFRARLGGGQLELPVERTDVARVAGPLVNESGLGRYDVNTLERVLAGRTVRIGFNVGDDAFGFGGNTSPKDLELSLQVLCASIVDPGYRSDALAQIRRGFRQSFERMLHTPGGIVALRVQPLLASGDPRFAIPPLDDMLAVEPDDVRALVAPALASGAIEIAIVGAIDIDETIAIAARTIGALPPRTAKPDYATARRVSYPGTPPSEEFEVETEIPKALVLVYWPTDDGFDVHRARRLTLLASAMRDRLRKVIREELGAAYGPSASSSPSSVYPGFGLFSVTVEVDPPQAQMIQETILRIADELQRNGVTEDEVERAREPAMTMIRDSARQNGYWLGAVLAQAQERPEVLDFARDRTEDFSAITKADLDRLAALYLDNNRAARFIVKPAPMPASAPAAAADASP